MRTTKSDVYYYLDLANELLENKLHFYHAYNYYCIDILDSESGGQRDLRHGLTLKEAYNIIYSIYKIAEIEKRLCL